MQQLDSEVQNFITDTQQAVWENTPEVKLKSKGNNYPKEIHKNDNEKRKVRRWHKQSENPKQRYIRLCRELKRMIPEMRNETFINYKTELSEIKIIHCRNLSEV